MGSVLPPCTDATAPTLFIAALADPGTQAYRGTPLQRLQIIKGWVDDDGFFHEEIYDVAGTAENGATVSRDTCAVEGSDSLCATRTDSDFAPSRSAVYYARILENPSCHWNAWQCIALSSEERPSACADPEIPWEIHEHAWTSPIWYHAD